MNGSNVAKVRSFFLELQELMKRHGIEELKQASPEFELTLDNIESLGVEVDGVEYEVYGNSIMARGSREGLAWNEQTPWVEVGKLKEE